MEQAVAQASAVKRGLGFADKQFIFIGIVLLALMVIVYFSVIAGGV